jgi:hypothetical protein
MIESFKRQPGALRWPPRQRFSLSAAGQEARQKRDRCIAAAREAEGGREAQEHAELEWATPLGILPGDGIYLEELAKGGRTVTHVAESLADCGVTRVEAQAAVDRLFKAGLLEPDQKLPPV